MFYMFFYKNEKKHVFVFFICKLMFWHPWFACRNGWTTSWSGIHSYTTESIVFMYPPRKSGSPTSSFTTSRPYDSGVRTRKKWQKKIPRNWVDWFRG